MDQGTQTLRTVADFGAVPPWQLPICLRAFRNWLQEQTEAGEGADAKLSEGFVWNPQERDVTAEPVQRTTDIRQLGFRPRAVSQFMKLRIYALEDFSEVSLLELSRLVNVGDTTVRRIRGMLQSVGLDLRETQDVNANASLAPVLQPPQALASQDDLPLGGMSLKPQTVKKLLLRNIRTVGDLRRQTPRHLVEYFSLARRHEIFGVLRSRNLNLFSNPTELELWRAGLVQLDDLRKPGDMEAVEHLVPWLGSALVRSAVAAHILTIGELRARAAVGAVQRTETRISPYSWVRIRRFFGMSSQMPLEAEAVD